MSLRHIGIVCHDTNKMVEFYKDFGFEPVYDEVEKVRIVKLKDKQGGMIELLQYETMGENILRQKGISHIAFTQDPEGNELEVVTECPK